jgi:nucleotide-binding universal stress UspA family protein
VDRTGGMFRRILVPVDFTKKNLQAVRLAARLASAPGSELLLLHVIERVDAGEPRGLAGFYKKLEKSAREKTQGLLEEVGRGPARGEIRYGNRVREILRYTQEKKIDLVVMSSHRLVLDNPSENWGTISYKVGILSRCPVLLVK